MDEDLRAHGLEGSLVIPDWTPLALEEVDRVLRRYPEVGGAHSIVSRSPRPFSAASVVDTPAGKVFVKRHALSIRDREGLLEEHRFIEYLHSVETIQTDDSPRRGESGGWRGVIEKKHLVPTVMKGLDGQTVFVTDGSSYEVHGMAQGIDLYERALSWTPFWSAGHAFSAGVAMARLHRAAQGYGAPRRKTRQLVSSFTIFSGKQNVDDRGGSRGIQTAIEAMESYIDDRPDLKRYAEQRRWREVFEELCLPYSSELERWTYSLLPLWTHNDFHGSNLTWSGAGADARVSGVIDFGLCDLTNAVHDLAVAIERNVVEWLRVGGRGCKQDARDVLHLDHLDALLDGYERLRPLSYEEARALVSMLPLVHCEFALSETDYFLSILNSPERAYLAYEGYFIAHTAWFHREDGKRLLGHLERWVESRPRTREAIV